MFGAGRQGFGGGGGSGDYYNEYQIWFSVPSGTTGTVSVAKEGGGEIDPSKYTVQTGQYPYGYDAIAWKMEDGEITSELAVDTDGDALQIDLSGDDNTTWTVAGGATPAAYPFAITFICVAKIEDFKDVDWHYVIGTPAPVILFPNVIQRSGVALKYDTDTQYNTNLSTGTGNITADLTDARLGATSMLFHSGGTEPTYPATWTRLSGSQNYNTSSAWNLIVSVYHSATFQTYYIVPADYTLLDHLTDLQNVGTYTHAQIDTFIGTTYPAVIAALKEPTGFPNRTDSTLTYSVASSLGKLEVTTASSYDIWFSGTKHTISTTKSISVPDEEGFHIIYFDTDDTLKSELNPDYGTMLTLITTKVLVGGIYWDATNKAIVYDAEERHGCVMDGITHYNLHYTRGMQWVYGLGLGDFVISTGNVDTHAQFSVETGSIADEDIGLTISPIGSTTGLPILYKLGANAYWRKLTQAGFSVYRGAGTRLSYNQYTGGAWKLTEVTNGNYVLCHVFATTGKTNQMFAIMGENQYTTLINARDGANTEISDIVLGTLPSPEIRPIATVIFQTGNPSGANYGNAVNARVVLTSEGNNYVDWRTSDLPRGSAPTDHFNLTNIGINTHAQIDAFIYTGRMEIKIDSDLTPLTVADGKAIFPIPLALNGYNLTSAVAFVTTASSSGLPTIQIRNVTDAVDMLSTPITIDEGELTSYTAETQPVIDTDHDDVATADMIAVDCDIAGTGTLGFGVILIFEKP